MNVNANGVGGYGVGGSYHVRIYRNDWENVLNESANAWRKMISPSLCPRKSEICLTRRALDGPICEIDLNGGGGLRSDEVWRSCASGRCWMTLYARTEPCHCKRWSVS